MALSGYLCNGGGTDDTSYLFTHRPTVNRSTLPKSIGMHSSAGGNDLQPEPTLSASLTDRDLIDGNDRSCKGVNKKYSNLILTTLVF